MSEAPWFSQNCKQLTDEWFLFMSAGARVAWMMLKNHVKTNAVSQKQPNRAFRMATASAALQWNLTKTDIAEMENAACKAGELVIEGDNWFVTERLAFQSERTAQRYEKGGVCPPETPTGGVSPQDVPIGEVCPTNADIPGQTPPPCIKTETETHTENPPSSPSGIPPKGKRVSRREALPPMVIPTAEEVAKYFREQGSTGEIARKFWNHYDIVDWKYGKSKTPLRKWKQAADNWIAEEVAKAAEAAKQAEARARASPGRPGHITAADRFKELNPDQQIP